MAEDVSLRLTLNDDASPKLRQVSSAAQSASTALSNMGRNMDRAFSSSTISNLGNTLQSTFTNATTAAEDLGDAVEDAFSGFENFDNGIGDIGDEFSDVADEIDDLSESIGDAGDSMEDLSNIADSVGDAIDGISDGADSFEEVADGADEAGNSLDEMSGASDRLASAAGNLIKVLAGMAILKEIGDYANKSVDDFTGFEKGMAEVSTLLSDSTTASMGIMQNQVKEFATDTGRLTTDIVPALYQAISASVPQENVFSFLETANKAATGGVTTLETAVDGLTSVINAYGQGNMSVERASDVMFTAVKLGKTNFEQMSAALFNVVPTAVNAGVAFEDVAAGLATITAAGTPTSVATTQMRQMLVELSDETKGAGETFQQVAGKSFRDFVAEGGNVNQALDLMYDHAQDTNKTIGQLFSSVEAGNAAAGLTGGRASVFAQDIAEMGTAAGATEEAYSKMTDTFAHKKDLMSAAWEDIRLDSGEALVTAMEPAVDSFLDNMDSIKEPIVGLFSTLGDLITAFAPMLPGAIDGVTGALKTFGNIVSPIFSMLADNPDAVGTAMTGIATGLVTMKAANVGADLISVAKGATEAGTGLGKFAMSLIGNPWALGAAALAGSALMIIDSMNKMEQASIETNLDTHFGSISLDTSQIDAIAEQIVDVDFTANMKLANVKFDHAEQLVSDAENLLAQNDFLWWKINSVGIKAGEDQQIISNSEQFESNLKTALEEKEYAVSLTIKGLLGDMNAEPIVSQIQQWFAEDEEAITNMGNAVSSLLERAFKEGADTANLEAAATIIQQKMLSMVDSTKMSEIEGELKWLDWEMDGAVLDPESWAAVTTKASELVHEQIAETSEAYQKTFGELERLASNNPERKELIGAMETVLGTAFNDYKNTAAGTVFEKDFASLNSAYETEINSISSAMSDSGFFEKIMGTDFQSGLTFAQMALEQGMNDMFKDLEPGTKGALAELYKSMAPTVEEMDDIITKASEQGKTVPESLMNAYNDAMMLAAATGDQEAMWQYMANQVAGQFPDKDTFVSELEKNGVDFSEWDEGIQTAFNKAFTETTAEGGDFDLLNKLLPEFSKENIDWSAVEGYLNEYGYSIASALQEQGIDLGDGLVPVHAEGNPIDTSQLAMSLEGLNYQGTTTLDGGEVAFEYTVNEGDTLSGIMEQYGVVWSEVEHQIAEANPEIPDLNLIYPDQVVKIPEAVVEIMNIDTTAAGEAVNEAVNTATENAGGEGVTAEVPVTADATIEAGTVDAGTAYDTVVEETTTKMADPITATGSTDVTLDQTNNSADVYSKVASEVQSHFNSTISASGNVAVTLNWTITNPTASVGVSVNGGTATATIASAHAEGGIFDTPHYGVFAEAGPEAFIPIDGSDNAKAIWQETGERLGMIDGMPKPNMSGFTGVTTDEGSGGGGKGSDKNINLNINGSGRMQISSGISKSDILQVMVDNVKDVLMNIIEQEILEEGDGAYEY